MPITTTELRRQYDYERFRDYSIVQMERDEITAAGEFLNTYTVSEIKYERDDKGLYLEDDTTEKLYLHSVSDASASKYDELAELRPEVAWQAKRVHVENDHIHFADNMPPGSLYVVISDCPEKELRQLGKNEFGYRLDRKMGFVQIFHASLDGKVTIYGHSFERNDPAGIQAMYGLFNKTYSESEWAISQPIYEEDAEAVDAEMLLERMIATYDNELTNQHGGEWFAGRDRMQMKEEGNSYVAKQRDLLDAHLNRLAFVNPKSEKANQLRYDFILAVRNRFENRAVVSTQDSSASAEMSIAGDMGRTAGEGVDFCGVTISAASMAQIGNMEKIGFQFNAKNEWKKGDCVACLTKNIQVGGCSVCVGCEHASNKGVDLMEVRKKALKAIGAKNRHVQSVQETHAVNESKVRTARQADPKYREVRRIVVGGVVTDIYDKKTGALVMTKN